MNITLYCDDIFQEVLFDNFNSLYFLIEHHFGIQRQNVIIKLNDRIINSTHKLNNGDLLYISSRVKTKHSLCNIFGEVNLTKFKMVIDSGAQSNVMSHQLAQKLNLEIDTRNSGIASGIGTSKIFGTVDCRVKINDAHYYTQFQVIHVNDNESKYLSLLGLSFMYENECEISLKHKHISINGEIIPFINDNESFSTPIKVESAIQKEYRKLNLELSQHIILKKIINNIINNPDENKYKCIHKDSATFKNNLSQYIDFMKLLGFTDNNTQLRYNSDVEPLLQLIEVM
jgi:hypothetical protein